MSAIRYILSDLDRYVDKVNFVSFTKNLLLNRSFKYSFWLRLAAKGGVLKLPASIVHRYLSGRYQIQISRSTQIGYGLYLGHHMCVVVSGSAVIGNNVNLSQFTTIGTNHGKAAEIGDNVYIGPGVCIVENVKIGSNSTIGAGSVVVKDVPNLSTVAGVPARVLSYENPGRYVNRRSSRRE